jgi:arsenate reductase
VSDDATDPTRIAFVCVQNAGRSQMASAFARRAVDRRGLADAVDVLTGGTRPADAVHDEVVAAMADVGVDVADRTPRDVGVAELQSCDYVVTMGCDASDVCPAGWGGENRDWDLEDPDGADPETVAAIRDTVERRVEALLDEIASRREADPA